MNERLLQYIWQFQLLNRTELLTTASERLKILHPGTWNRNQGPDFLNGKIEVSGMVWVGHIELHVHTSDWLMHGHSEDENYRNIVLHVVWKHDRDPGLGFPTLELQPLVPQLLLRRYRNLMETQAFIPCEGNLSTLRNLILTKWKERLLFERLEEKCRKINDLLSVSKGDWEEVCWWLTARYFGGRVNGDSFERLAQSIPLSILHRQNETSFPVEAILFGQSGLLTHKLQESYPMALYKEYLFQRKKYSLRQPPIAIHFLRMRPANFPTIKLAQLSAIITRHKKMMRDIIEVSDLSIIRSWFDIPLAEYWCTHYRFDEASPFLIKRIGNQSIDHFIINVAVPLCYAYGAYHKLSSLQQKALQWLEMSDSESNTIIHGFGCLGIHSSNAFEAQALMQLKNNYCDYKRCLECDIGSEILRKSEIAGNDSMTIES